MRPVGRLSRPPVRVGRIEQAVTLGASPALATPPAAAKSRLDFMPGRSDALCFTERSAGKQDDEEAMVPRLMGRRVDSGSKAVTKKVSNGACHGAKR